jgi:general L-amino acid transport system permease protein
VTEAATSLAHAPDPRLDGVTSPGWLLRVAHWLKQNLFNSFGNAVLTLVVATVLVVVVPKLIRWGITDATLWGVTKSACTGDGACWAFIRMRLPLFVVGLYPTSELWRVVLAFALLVAFAIPVLRENTRHRGIYAVALITVFPVLAGVLLAGDVAGLPSVDTNLWGGLMLDVIIAFVAVAGSLPLGILLAFGRRSRLSVIRTLSVCFIELWRGVPLLTVLFMAAVMLPLFLPHGVTVDRLVRAMVALVLFNAAYMAEIVRGGLQGVEKGQEEAAASLGLNWLQTQALVVLPQAMRVAVPGIINTVVDLFKDTTLVTIVGLSDLLGAVNQSLKDPDWLGLPTEGYTFAALVFFVCCFAMSAYGRSVERHLGRSTFRAQQVAPVPLAETK